MRLEIVFLIIFNIFAWDNLVAQEKMQVYIRDFEATSSIGDMTLLENLREAFKNRISKIDTKNRFSVTLDAAKLNEIRTFDGKGTISVPEETDIIVDGELEIVNSEPSSIQIYLYSVYNDTIIEQIPFELHIIGVPDLGKDSRKSKCESVISKMIDFEEKFQKAREAIIIKKKMRL